MDHCLKQQRRTFYPHSLLFKELNDHVLIWLCRYGKLEGFKKIVESPRYKHDRDQAAYWVWIAFVNNQYDIIRYIFSNYSLDILSHISHRSKNVVFLISREYNIISAEHDKILHGLCMLLLRNPRCSEWHYLLSDKIVSYYIKNPMDDKLIHEGLNHKSYDLSVCQLISGKKWDKKYLKHPLFQEIVRNVRFQNRFMNTKKYFISKKCRQRFQDVYKIVIQESIEIHKKCKVGVLWIKSRRVYLPKELVCIIMDFLTPIEISVTRCRQKRSKIIKNYI